MPRTISAGLDLAIVGDSDARSALRRRLGSSQELRVTAELELGAFQRDAFVADIVLIQVGSSSAPFASESGDLAIDLRVPAVLIGADATAADAAIRSRTPVALLPEAVDSETLHEAIRAVHVGLTVIHPALPNAPRLQGQAPPAGPSRDVLSDRETEVLRLLAEGRSNRGLAGELGISEHTVKFHVSAILGKLHAASRTEAVAIAARRGLIAL